jgi:hypothetical protein
MQDPFDTTVTPKGSSFEAMAGEQMNSVEDIQRVAKQKGMALVDDSENLDDTESKFEDIIIEADRLSNAVDDEKEPYKSKYAANELMEQARRDFLARKLVSFTNAKTLDYKLNGRFTALLDYRIAKNCMETEEPHNAEPRLLDCLDFFFPDMSDVYYKAVEQDGEHPETDPDTSVPAVEDVTDAEGEGSSSEAVAKFKFDEWMEAGATGAELPDFDLRDPKLMPYANEVIDTLNHMGILWCNRTYTSRAFLFLKKAERMYEELLAARLAGKLKSTPSSRRQTESLHTHTLFYLAQLYAQLGHAGQSASYCHKTLERQLVPGFEESGMDKNEWVKNALGLASYYTNVADQRYQAAYTLAACMHVIELARGQLSEEMRADRDEAVNITRADTLKAKGGLYLKVLQMANEHREINENLAQMPEEHKEEQMAAVANAVKELDLQMEAEIAGCVKFSTLEAGNALPKIDSNVLSATKVGQWCAPRRHSATWSER